jgi:hypothetical protein
VADRQLAVGRDRGTAATIVTIRLGGLIYVDITRREKSSDSRSVPWPIPGVRRAALCSAIQAKPTVK